jgi:hypothetical protein
MPSSGGSVSDAPVNKVVDGKSHYLAYITPDEGKSLMNQGGKEVVTDQGIPAYPPPGERGGPGSGSEGRAESSTGGAGEGGTITEPVLTYTTPSSRQPGLETSTSVAKQTALQEDIRNQPTETKETLITKIKNKIIPENVGLNIASKMGWLTDNAFISALSGAISFVGMLGTEAQEKAITWDLNRRLNKAKFPDDKRSLEDQIRKANLPSDHPDHYSQSDYMKDYPGALGSWGPDGNLTAEASGGAGEGQNNNARGLTNVITPYAAHAIGGTTPVNSQAAQWYANMGSGNSNPGAFNLTQQYAAAKAKVSQTLGSSTSVGQLAVNQSPFYNWLKDNSLNKGIL